LDNLTIYQILSVTVGILKYESYFINCNIIKQIVNRFKIKYLQFAS